MRRVPNGSRILVPGSRSIQLTPVADSVSSLSEAGLAATWSPLSLVEHGYFALNNTIGLPWWATVIAGAACTRLVLLPVQIWALKKATKIHNHMPEELELQRAMVQAAKEKNKDLAVEKYGELFQHYKKHKYVPMENLRSAIVTLPVAGLASLSLLEISMLSPPLTGMTTGGLLWWTDLTVRDPLFLMPLFCSVSTFANLLTGAETGLKPVRSVRRYMWNIIPLGVFAVASMLPATLQLFWVSNMLLGMAFSRLIKTGPVRSMLGIEEWKTHAPSTIVRAAGAGGLSFMNDFKQAVRTAEEVGLRTDEVMMRSRWAAKLDQNTMHHEQLVAASRYQKIEHKHTEMDFERTKVRPLKEELQESELLHDELEKPYMKRPSTRKGPPRSKPA